MSRWIHRMLRPSKSAQWRLECLGHSLLELAAAALPGSLVFRLGEWLGILAWHILPQRRRIVLKNLRVAYCGELELPAIEQLARQSFRRSGANLVSTAHTARLKPTQLHKILHIENRELLEEKLATGRGVVLLLAHMGNWELLSRIIHLFPAGAKCGAFYRPLNNLLLDQRVLTRRQADGTRMFSKRDPFHQVTKFLRDGGIVGILSDQRVGRQGEVVPFFGRQTRATPLPSLLARRAKAEILALSLVTVAPGKWKAVFYPVEPDVTTHHCMAALEKAMRSSPADVFWLQDRWKVYAGNRMPLRKWLDHAEQRSNKPHRALIWNTNAADAWQIPNDWIHPDVDYERLDEASTRAAAAASSPAELAELLTSIDHQQVKPLDFILAPSSDRVLRRAAKQVAIPLIPLS
ncbi:MAG: lysophospholipid acyltransferase family protein [Luteolibacter sp.]